MSSGSCRGLRLICFKHVADDWILLATALRLAAGAVQDPLERSASWSLRGMVCLGTAALHGEHRNSIDEAISIPVEGKSPDSCRLPGCCASPLILVRSQRRRLGS